MASRAHSIPTPAQQPELRPYIVYDRLPAGHIAHLVLETTCPILHHGETIVIDPSDCTIAVGDLFVMESGRSNPNGPQRNIVEFKQRDWCIADDDGEFRNQPCWSALFYSAINDFRGGSEPIRMTDGPVRLSSAVYFEERIIGRIVGILESSFVEPMRRLAA